MDNTEEFSSSSDEERNWSMIVHLSGLAGLLCPFANIVVPLVIWLIKRPGLPMVDTEGREAVNFQISVTVYLLLCIPAMFILIGGVLFPVILLFWLIFSIRAAIFASKGEEYSYPFIFRLLKE